MFTKRTSDEGWIKYLLSTGLIPVDQLQAMRGNQSQFDLTELLLKHVREFNEERWINQALQQDRFQYIPIPEAVDLRELEELKKSLPFFISSAVSEGIIPLSFENLTVYLGLIRYDAEFPELQTLLQRIPAEIQVILVPLSPQQYARLLRQLRAAAL